MVFQLKLLQVICIFPSMSIQTMPVARGAQAVYEILVWRYLQLLFCNDKGGRMNVGCHKEPVHQNASNMFT